MFEKGRDRSRIQIDSRLWGIKSNTGGRHEWVSDWWNSPGDPKEQYEDETRTLLYCSSVFTPLWICFHAMMSWSVHPSVTVFKRDKTQRVNVSLHSGGPFDVCSPCSMRQKESFVIISATYFWTNILQQLLYVVLKSFWHWSFKQSWSQSNNPNTAQMFHDNFVFLPVLWSGQHYILFKSFGSWTNLSEVYNHGYRHLELYYCGKEKVERWRAESVSLPNLHSADTAGYQTFRIMQCPFKTSNYHLVSIVNLRANVNIMLRVPLCISTLNLKCRLCMNRYERINRITVKRVERSVD